MNKRILILIGIVVGVCLGISGYVAISRILKPSFGYTPITTTSTNNAAAPAPTIPDGWTTETNAVGHYTLAHPADWQRLTKLELATTMTVVASPANVTDLNRKNSSEWLPDFQVKYYETDGDLAGVNGKPLRYQSLADYLEPNNQTSTGVIDHVTKWMGAYPGYMVELPGISGRLNYMTSVAGHVYVFSYADNQKETAERMIETFRVTTKQSAQGVAPYFSDTLPFSFFNPEDYTVREATNLGQRGSNMNLSGVELTVPATLTTNTNLDPDTAVSIEQAPSAKNCTANTFFANPVSLQTLTDRGTVYSVGTVKEQVAGKIYEEIVYARTKSLPCLGVRYSIHSGDVSNYPIGTIQFDRTALLNEFDTIRRSISLTK